MVPTEAVVEWQTSEIVKYLFEDDLCVPCCVSMLEPDGPGGSEDDFDPVVIADKLRTVADALNDDAIFKAALNDLKKAAMQEAADAAFCQGVRDLCQAHVFQSPEVTSEIHLIKASVALGLYVVKSSPDLKYKVKDAMTTFFNRQLRKWVIQQGGWEKVNL